MSSRLIVPFDFRPQSTTIKTALYTIPAGKYALAFPSFSVGSQSSGGASSHSITASGTITLNGTILFRAPVTHAFTLISTNTVTTENHNKRLSISAYSSSSTFTMQADGNIFMGNSGTGNLYCNHQMISSNATVFRTNALCEGNISYVDIRQDLYVNGIWVKSGDVLSGTNAGGSAFQWTVIEYNSVS